MNLKGRMLGATFVGLGLVAAGLSLGAAKPGEKAASAPFTSMRASRMSWSQVPLKLPRRYRKSSETASTSLSLLSYGARILVNGANSASLITPGERRCGSQVARQRFAKPLYVGSNPIRTSNNSRVMLR